MKKFIAIIFLICFSVLAFNANAGVRFIVDSPSHTKRDKITKPTVSPSINNCVRMGYIRTSCNSDEHAVEACPYNGNYFRYCCPADYSYTAKECKEMGMKTSGSSCHGYYRCEYPNQ